MEYEFDFDNAIENLDSVPDDLKHFYAKEASGYKVSPTMVGAAKRINGLSTNLKTERTKVTNKNKEAQDFRQSASGFKSIVESLTDLPEDQRTPEGLKSYLDSLAVKATAGGKKGEDAIRQIEAVKAEMARDKAEALKAKENELSQMQGSLFNYMVGDVANSALSEHKGNSLFLRPHIDRQTKVVKQDDGSYAVRVLDERGEIRYNGQGDPMTVPQLVEVMKRDDKFAPAFEGRVASGAGNVQSKKTDQRQANAIDPAQKTSKQKIADGLRARRAARG
jgi:hypothetical protein